MNVHGGAHVPTGDYSNGFKTGFNVGANGDIMVNDQWAVGADGSFNRSKHEDDGKTTVAGTIKDRFRLYQFGAHAKYLISLPGAPVSPYIVAGVRMYNAKEDYAIGSTDFSGPSEKDRKSVV